jgi:pentatricopeptide repeat protein
MLNVGVWRMHAICLTKCVDVVSCKTMISGYAQNEHIDEAFRIIQKMPPCDVFSWTKMIAAYAKHRYSQEDL